MFPRNIKNRIALIKSYLTRQERLNAFPFEIAIGITNRCNLDCSFCPHRISPRSQGNISLDLLDSLITQVSPYADVVDLSFDGEPFLHPEWSECVKICHRHGVRAILQSNGLLVDEAVTHEILEAGVDSITFSVDAATEETYRRLKLGGNFKLVLKNVEYFLQQAAQTSRRPRITVQFVRGPENRDEADDFLSYWRGKGADSIRIKPMLNFGGSVGSIPRSVPGKPCILLWTSLSIHWDGIVTLCCMDIEGRTNMGDASKTPLREIADSDLFRAVRRLHINGTGAKHPVCRNCDVPAVAWPFVLGSAFVDDMTRRQVIRLVQNMGFLQAREKT
ncbi:MAG TPA: radical SAM protein [Proteobacteria bacterium]|nr:radical SAM protein [Pseudomonadota bacterium]